MKGRLLKSDVVTDETADIVRRAAGGDRAAFAELYRLHVDRVHAVCLRLSGDPARAEELVQDVFIRTWRKLGTFGGRSRFSTWLHRLTVNVALDGLRQDQRWHLRFDEADAMESTEAEAAAVSAAGAVEARLDLERAIATLPPGARTVLVLRDVEGMKYRDVAEATGLALGTVKAQIHRARRLLRERLDR